MFLGGATRYFTNDYLPENNNIGFHGHYDRNGRLDANLVRRYGLRDWIIKHSDGKADPVLVERWINLPYGRGMIHFFIRNWSSVREYRPSCARATRRARYLLASRLPKRRSISASSHRWTLCAAPIADFRSFNLPMSALCPFQKHARSSSSRRCRVTAASKPGLTGLPLRMLSANFA